MTNEFVKTFIVKIQEGYLLQLSCKNNTNAAKFPVYRDENIYRRFNIQKRGLSQTIFDVCVKPKSGELITASYFHLVPLINVEEVPGEIVSFNLFSQDLVINKIYLFTEWHRA